jgi:hypothetical protein
MPVYDTTKSPTQCVAKCSSSLLSFTDSGGRIYCLRHCPVQAPFADKANQVAGEAIPCVSSCNSPTLSLVNATGNFCVGTCPPGTIKDLTRSPVFCVKYCEGYFNSADSSCTSTCSQYYNNFTLPLTCEASCPSNSYIFTDSSSKAFCVATCPSSSPYIHSDGVQCTDSCPLYVIDQRLLKCTSTCPASAPYKSVDSAGNSVCQAVCPIYYKESPTRECVSSCTTYLDFTLEKTTCVTACLSGAVTYANSSGSFCMVNCPLSKPIRDSTASP